MNAKEEVCYVDLKKLANSIGITVEYPQEMEEIYCNLSQVEEPACDIKAVEQLEKTYHLFGVFYKDVLQAADAINADPLRSAWVRVASRYAEGASVAEACGVPAPPMNGALANDFLALFVMLPQLIRGVEEYIRRGFSHAELTELFSNFQDSIGIVRRHTGHSGVNQDYYNWLTIFAKARIFLAKGLWFELYELPVSAMWLKNKQTGQFLPVALRGPFSADGKHRIGSAGYEECTDIFEITFEEDAEKYIGHGVYDCTVSSQKEVFLKSQWECVTKPYDPCLSLHIPVGADISVSNLTDAVKLARETMAQRYPEIPCGAVYCSSWLLDPTLQELTGEKSRLSTFANCFCRHPKKNNGMSVFSFVFPRYCPDYNDLPENTSLQKKVKKLYLDGEYIYFTAGIYTEN